MDTSTRLRWLDDQNCVEIGTEWYDGASCNDRDIVSPNRMASLRNENAKNVNITYEID